MKGHFEDIAKNIFYLVITALAVLALREMDDFSSSIERLSTGVAGLNAKMEVVLEKISNQQTAITDHEARMRRIEAAAKLALKEHDG